MKIETLFLAISLMVSLPYADMGGLHDDWLDPDWLDPSAESEKTLPEFEGHTKSSLQDTCAYKSANGEKKAEDVKSSQNLVGTTNGMPHFTWQTFIFIAAIIIFIALFLTMVMGYEMKNDIAEQKARIEALQKELQSRPLQAIEPPGRRTQDGLPNPVQETHRDNEVKLNNFGGQPNTVDSIGASSTWNLRQ
jgi:Tfp pilus assembly major pilin PilA